MQQNHSVSGRPVVSGAPPLSQKLKIATGELHERAEKHPFQASVVDGRASRTAYAIWLRQLREIHATLESLFTEQGCRVIECSSVIDRDQFKTRLIDHDLRVLAPENSLVQTVPATEAIASRIRSDVAESPLSLLGYWYVLEGATNGNKFLARFLSRVFGGNDGLSYLDPYGDQQRQTWMRWKTRIDELHLPGDVESRIVDAAKAMFLGLVEIMDVLLNLEPVSVGMSIDGLVAGGTLSLQAMRRGLRAPDSSGGR